MNLDTHSQIVSPHLASETPVPAAQRVVRHPVVGDVPVLIRKRRGISSSTADGAHLDPLDIPKPPRVFVVAAADAGPTDSQGPDTREDPAGPGRAAASTASPRRRRVRSDRRPGEVTHIVFPTVDATSEAHESLESAPLDLALPDSPSPYVQVMAALAELREVVRMAERASHLRFV